MRDTAYVYRRAYNAVNSSLSTHFVVTVMVIDCFYSSTLLQTSDTHMLLYSVRQSVSQSVSHIRAFSKWKNLQ